MQILFSQIGSSQHTYDFTVIVDRCIETSHYLIEKMGVKYDIRTFAAVHAVQIKGTVRYIRSPAVTDMVYTIGIREKKYVKQRMFYKFVQHGKCDSRFSQSVFYEINIGGDQIQSIVEFFIDLDSRRAGGVSHIAFVPFFHPSAVLGRIPEKQ